MNENRPRSHSAPTGSAGAGIHNEPTTSPTTTLETAHNRRPSYAYVALVAGVIGSIMTVPGQTNGMSPFIDMLIEALGLSRVWISSAYMIGTAASALILTRAGVLYDRFGARVVGTASAALLGVSLLGLARVGGGINALSAVLPFISRHWIAVLLLSAGFLGARFFGQGVLSMVSRNMIMTWFNDRRGPANAILGTSIALAFAAAPILFNLLIQRFGWQGAWTVLGLSLGVVAVLVALTFRDANEQERTYSYRHTGRPDRARNTAGSIRAT
ncbi:MAG: MFS transporter, partial [Spirochaetota bacterium]